MIVWKITEVVKAANLKKQHDYRDSMHYFAYRTSYSDGSTYFTGK